MGELREHHIENVGERTTHRVDPEHHERFRDPGRLERLQPEKLVEAFGPEEGDVVLDVGCGDGLFLGPLSRAVGGRGSVVGLDVEPKMIEAARETVRAENLENVQLLVVTDEAIDLPDDAADAAILVNTLHEMAYPSRTLAELRRVIRPGGRVLVFDRNNGDTGEEGPPEHHLLSRVEARRMLLEAGFEEAGEIDWDPAMYALLFS